jgi:hypothetical protein
MNGKTLTKRQKFSGIIITIPFLCAVTLLIIGLFTLDDKYLQNNFSISFIAIAIFMLVHISTILILKRFDKIDIELPKTLLKKVFSILGLLVLFFLSNLLLEMGLRMNLNNWLKKDNVEKIELIVIDKKVSQGRATDYYIIFNSSNGKLKNKVGGKKYRTFSIGEKYQASVKEGYFDGYFLIEPMNRISN